jgi:MFS family permease
MADPEFESGGFVTEQQRNARFALAVLFGINLMNFFDRQIPGVLAEPIRHEFELNDTQLGWLTTVFTLVYAAVGVPLGRLTDNWLRTRLIAIGVTVWSALTAASGLAWNYASFVAARIGVGIGEASCAPASQSLIGDLFPTEQRARAMSIFMLGLPLGLFASYVLCGEIGEAWGWRAAYFVACVPGILLAVLVLFIKEPLRGAADPQTPKAPRRTFKEWLFYTLSWMRAVLRIRTMWWITLSGMLFNFNAYAINGFQTPFLQRFHGLSLSEASMISGLSLGLAGALGLLVGGWLGDRVRVVLPAARVLLPAMSLLIAMPCVVMALQQPKGSVDAFMLLMAASTALSYVYYATVYSAIQDVVPPSLRGTAVSLYFFVMYVLGASFGTTITGALSDYFANQAMVAAGANEMAEVFRASGLHTAMYLIPALMLLCSGSLFGAARTIRGESG